MRSSLFIGLPAGALDRARMALGERTGAGPRRPLARDGAGWHLCLQSLARTLGGQEIGRGEDVDGLPPEWRELNRAYGERFEIDPAQATPPPSR